MTGCVHRRLRSLLRVSGGRRPLLRGQLQGAAGGALGAGGGERERQDDAAEGAGREAPGRHRRRQHRRGGAVPAPGHRLRHGSDHPGDAPDLRPAPPPGGGGAAGRRRTPPGRGRRRGGHGPGRGHRGVVGAAGLRHGGPVGRQHPAHPRPRHRGGHRPGGRHAQRRRAQAPRARRAVRLRGARSCCVDEPDNYLDVPAKAWLEQLVKASTKTVLAISHDREFLEQRRSTKIVTLESAGTWVHGGSYATYPEAREHRQRAARRRPRALERRGAPALPAHEDHEAAGLARTTSNATARPTPPRPAGSGSWTPARRHRPARPGRSTPACGRRRRPPGRAP